MLPRIRCRCTINTKTRFFQFRHYSSSDDFKTSSITSFNKTKDISNKDSKSNIHVHTINNHHTSNTKSSHKFSNAVSSFLQSSINNLENYIIQQAPTESDKSVHGFNNNILEIDNDSNSEINERDSLINDDIPIDFYWLNKNIFEYIDLTNPKHIDFLLTFDEGIYNHGPEIEQHFMRSSMFNMPFILNFYLRSIPDIQRLYNIKPELHTLLGDNMTKYIISIMIQNRWFKAASFMILRMNLKFTDLVNFLDELLQNEFLLKTSKWMRYLFIINFYQFYKNINPLVISNLDILSSQPAMNTFKVMNMIWKTHYTSNEALDRDVNEWFDSIGKEDALVKFMHIYKSIDLIKYQYPLESGLQNKHFQNLFQQNIGLITSGNFFLSSFLSKIVGLNKYELSRLSTFSNDEITKFIDDRKSSILSYILLTKNIQVKGYDSLTVLQLNPENALVNTQLWEYHVKGMNNSLVNTLYYKILVANFVKQFKGTKRLHEIMKVEFPNLSSNQKIRLIKNSLILYLKKRDTFARNRVGGYITLINQQNEHSYIMKKVISDMFSFPSNSTTLATFGNLLRTLELIASFSPTLTNKQSLFEFADKLMRSNVKKFSETEKFSKLVKFIELLKKIDPESTKYAVYLTPSIVRFYTNLTDQVSTNGSMSHFTALKETLTVCHLLNKAFDVACDKPRLLSSLNPKNYSSKIYITSQTLLGNITREIFKLPKPLIVHILKSRSKWLCTDQYDWIFKFHQNTFIYGVFLEVVLRKGAREMYALEIDVSNLKYPEYQKLLDDEIDAMATNELFWECITVISGFEWNDELRDVFLNGKILDEDGKLGDGVIMVLNEVQKVHGVNFQKRVEKIENLRNELINETKINEQFEDVTDALFDSTHQSTVEYGTIFDEIFDNNNNSTTDESTKNDSSTVIPQLVEFNEVHKMMKKYEDFIPKKRSLTGVTFYNGKNSKKGSGRIKRRYTFREKERLIKMFSPLRVKHKLVESLIKQKPELIDAMIRRLFIEYRECIPISLIHSCMIGIIRSEETKEFGFNEKINLLKVLDLLVSIIYSKSSKKAHSYLFMYIVRFKEFRIRLVDMIINESKKSNSGSLKTLNWAINKITGTINMSQYKKEFDRWTNELNNMKESKIGFWNPHNAGKWIRRD